MCDDAYNETTGLWPNLEISL